MRLGMKCEHVALIRTKTMTNTAFSHGRLVFSGHELGLEISQSSTCVAAYTQNFSGASPPSPPAQFALATLAVNKFFFPDSCFACGGMSDNNKWTSQT